MKMMDSSFMLWRVSSIFIVLRFQTLIYLQNNLLVFIFYLAASIWAIRLLLDPDVSVGHNWDNPFSGNILNEDGSDIQMERGGTYLYPRLEFPEAETGTISIDVSFNSDILLEDDNGTYGWGYLLHEESAGQGNGPQRYISLEEDTQGPDHQYESIPIVDTHILETWFNSTRAHLISDCWQFSVISYSTTV